MTAGFQVRKLVSIAFLIISVTSCSVVNDGSTTIKPSPLSSYFEDPNAELGTRNNPIALGEVALVNDWQVEILSVNKNAQEVVLAADSYANPPSPGENFMLLEIRAIYLGDSSGEPSSDLRFKIVGALGNTFSKSCSYASDTFTENEETFYGAAVTGSLCFVVDANQIAGAVVSIQGDYATQDRKFIAVD